MVYHIRIVALCAAIWVSLAPIQSALAQSQTSNPKLQQAKLWAQLDLDTRRTLVERSKYVFRISDDLVIDAYAMIHWREKLDSLVSRKSILDVKKNGNVIRKRKVGYEWVFLDDREIEAEYSLPTYGAHYWYKGVLVNDQGLWGSSEYAHLLDDAGASGIASTQTRDSIVEIWIDQNWPRIVVVDPIAQVDPSIELYSMRSSECWLLRGAVGAAYGHQRLLPVPNGGQLSIWPGDLRERRSTGRCVLPQVIGSKAKDGQPEKTLDSFLLVPSNFISGGTALGPSSRRKTSAFEIRDFKRYRIDPKELAMMWYNGQLEIAYRELERVGGDLVCTEHLLERP